jgi:hypothetical protein
MGPRDLRPSRRAGEREDDKSRLCAEVLFVPQHRSCKKRAVRRVSFRRGAGRVPLRAEREQQSPRGAHCARDLASSLAGRWIAGTSPAMTDGGRERPSLRLLVVNVAANLSPHLPPRLFSPCPPRDGALRLELGPPGGGRASDRRRRYSATAGEFRSRRAAVRRLISGKGRRSKRMRGGLRAGRSKWGTTLVMRSGAAMAASNPIAKSEAVPLRALSYCKTPRRRRRR